MTQLRASIVVLEHELNVLRGLRVSTETAIAEAAVIRERSVERELVELRRLDSRQGLLELQSMDEEPLAIAASQQAGGR